jgi:DNA-nicking Smr family endonuclease
LNIEQLKLVQRELQRRRLLAEQLARENREREQRLDRERRQFELAVGLVTRLPEQGLTHLRRSAPEPEPLQREQDEQAAALQAMSDDFDVDSLLETDEELSFRRPSIPPNALNKLRRGEWSLQAQIDLHGLRRDEAREALGHFLNRCNSQGLRCVRVVHGKGHGSPGKEGVLRVKVRRWLVQRDEVLAFVQARAAEGGAGALVVLLQGN